MPTKPPADDPFLREPPVAGNGLLDRRALLKAGALGLVTGLATGRAAASASDPASTGQPGWMSRPGASPEGYGQPARYELARLQRSVRPLEASRAQSVSPIARTPLDLLRGSLMPNGMHFEVSHHGIPNIAPEAHDLVVHGMVQRPLVFDLEILERYPSVTQAYFLECAGNGGVLWAGEPAQVELAYTHGLLSASEWTGVPLAVLLQEAGVRPGARWVVAEGADSGSLNRSIPLQKALDDSLVALYQNGERLRPGQGYPMRLLNPGYEGNTSVKWLRSVRVTDRPAMSRFETARYTDLMPGGEALQFTLEMEVKSVITRPSNTVKLTAPGYHEISGLAWSGSGRIRRVEVSADGGRSWAEALLQEPVRPKALTLFRIPWRWQGGGAILQSRATDESGRVQPTREALIAARGSRTHYHFNAIHSWGVYPDGAIRHVYA